jgi:hypothetical protein
LPLLESRFRESPNFPSAHAMHCLEILNPIIGRIKAHASICVKALLFTKRSFIASRTAVVNLFGCLFLVNLGSKRSFFQRQIVAIPIYSAIDTFFIFPM